MSRIDALAWPAHAMGHALRRVAATAGYPVRTRASGPGLVPTDVELPRWISAHAHALDLDATAVEIPHAELATTLLRAAPALVALPGGGGALAIVGARGGALRILSASTGRIESVPVAAVRTALAGEVEADAARAFDRALAGLAPRVAVPARAALVAERLRAQTFAGCWLVRPSPGASFWAQASSEGLGRRSAAIVAMHLGLVAASIAGWTILGTAALQGTLQTGWAIAWGLVLATFVAIYVVQAWLRGRLAVDFGRLLKRRLLRGAMRIDDELVRREGAGQLVGRALETNAIDSLAPSAGLGAVLSTLELAPVCAWLVLGSGGLLHALALGSVGLVLAALGVAAYRRTVAWTDSGRALTHELVERMAGHRTRLAQRHPDRWHDGEDELLEHRARVGAEIDGFEVWFQAVPQIWLVVGLALVAPGFVRGDAPATLAIALGGTLLAYGSLGQIAQGLRQVIEAVAGWRQLAPLFDAAARPSVEPAPEIAVLEPGSGEVGSTLLSATGLSYAYPGRARPVLDDVSLTIARGERILLEGPSGGGKSTLAALLAGLKLPTSGLLLLDGFDHPTLGERGWRARVAAAAQYHDNHIFADTFAFNALLGRPSWPETREDVEELLEVCTELGLDDLLARMSGGVAQTVGEGGWRLSHGERSRVFIARALLQKAPLVILDESFAALDPKTLDRCLRCVLARAETLVVIAHP